MPRKAAAKSKASGGSTSSAPIVVHSTALSIKSPVISRWPYSTPKTIEEALQDDDSPSSSKPEVDPFTGQTPQRVYTPMKSPSHAQSPKSRPAAPVAARRSLKFDDDAEKDQVAKPAAKKRKAAAASAKNKKAAAALATSPPSADSTSKTDRKKSPAGTKKVSAAASEALEAQKKYFTDLDATVQLPEALPDLNAPKYVLGTRSPTTTNSGTGTKRSNAAATDASVEDEASPLTKERELAKRFPNAKKNYQEYVAAISGSGVDSLMTFDEFVSSGADLEAALHAEGTHVKNRSPKKTPGSPSAASPKKVTLTPLKIGASMSPKAAAAAKKAAAAQNEKKGNEQKDEGAKKKSPKGKRSKPADEEKQASPKKAKAAKPKAAAKDKKGKK